MLLQDYEYSRACPGKETTTDESKTSPFLVPSDNGAELEKNWNEWHVRQNTHWSKLLKCSSEKQHKNISRSEQNK